MRVINTHIVKYEEILTTLYECVDHSYWIQYPPPPNILVIADDDDVKDHHSDKNTKQPYQPILVQISPFEALNLMRQSTDPVKWEKFQTFHDRNTQYSPKKIK